MEIELMQLKELVLWSTDAERSDQFLKESLPDVFSPPPLPGLGRVRHHRRPVFSTEPASPGAQSAFWKYSVFADSIAEFSDQIRPEELAVTRPVQFLDIGYLCHLTEPGGNEIELLQRSFVPPLAPQSASGYRGTATLGLITLRVSDLAATLHLLINGLGMSHLATMGVNDGRPDPFELEFLAWTHEIPPSVERADVANREWLYQRPYTIIELQHGPAIHSLEDPKQRHGLCHIEISSPSLSAAQSKLSLAGEGWEPVSPTAIVVITPDGHQLRISQAN